MQQLSRLLIFLIQPYMFRATNLPILRSTFWLYIQLLVQCTGRQQCRCIVPKVVYTVKKCSWGWANLSPETCTAELKKIKKRKSCCILLVIYIVVLKWYTVTQTLSIIIYSFYEAVIEEGDASWGVALTGNWKNVRNFNKKMRWEWY